MTQPADQAAYDAIDPVDMTPEQEAAVFADLFQYNKWADEDEWPSVTKEGKP